MKRTLQKGLSILLTVALVLNMGLTLALAQTALLGASGLTDCHPAHSSECGYTETTPCTHSCAQCRPLDSGKECACPPVDSGEQLHDKNCPLYTPVYSAAVKALIAMVDALPNADTITDKNREAVNPDFDAALMAYEALSPEDKAAFEATGQHKKLMALHKALYPSVLLAGGTVTLDITGADKYVNITATGYKVGTAATETAHTGGYIITGTATGTNAAWNHVMVSGGTHNITLKDASIQLSDSDKAAFSVEGSSTVNLTLEGTNVLKSGGLRAGLEVIAGNALTITNASTGSLSATGGNRGAGIGGGNKGAGGTITISGGTVTGTGGANGAGIGGGLNSAGGEITINGGTVKATGSIGGAGIGGGDGGGASGDITISGNAVVFATKGAAAPNHIGAGKGGANGNIAITGGIVFEGKTGTVLGTSVAPTDDFTIPADHTLTIAGGQTVDVGGVTATNNGAVINSGTILGEFKGNPPVNAGNAVVLDISNAADYIEIIATGYKVGGGAEKPHNGSYIFTGTATDTDASSHIKVSGGTHNILLKGADIQLAADGIYGERKCAFEITGGAAVNLTLVDTNTLQSGLDRTGLEVSTGNALTITEASTGSLSAKGGAAGIGGSGSSGPDVDGGEITINGGAVTATGAFNSAGIGGGAGGDGGTITISNGTVTATGGNEGAGIGGGKFGNGGTIEITGGKVAATGGDGEGIGGGAGIGGGLSYPPGGSNGGNITISGGEVTATGGTNGAGIGGGSAGGAGGTCNISSG